MRLGQDPIACATWHAFESGAHGTESQSRKPAACNHGYGICTSLAIACNFANTVGLVSQARKVADKLSQYKQSAQFNACQARLS